MAVAQQPEGAQDVGVALAGHEVGDGDERVRPPLGRLGRQVRAEVHDAHVARPERAAAPGDARGVGEHEPRVRQAGAHGVGAGGGGLRHRQDVAAVDGDDDRHARSRAADRVAGGAA